jgi:hypothetical protein
MASGKPDYALMSDEGDEVAKRIKNGLDLFTPT